MVLCGLPLVRTMSLDGEKVLTYNHYQLDHDVPPRKIQYIIDDAKGFIWIKTIDHKLYLFDKKKECFKAVYGNIKKVCGKCSGY